MQTKIWLFTACVIVSAVVLVALALLPFNWEFVGPAFDVVGHVLGVCITAVALGMVFRRGRERFWSSIRRMVGACVGAFALWAGIEAIQYYIPHHGPQWEDLRSDFFGMYVGVAVLFLIEVTLLVQSQKSASTGTVP